MQPIILRDDQARLKQGVYDGWARGLRNMLAVLPTGGGKSIIVSDIVLDNNRMGKRQCVIAHRNELVQQMSLHIARREIEHHIIGPQSMISQIVAAHRREFKYSFVNPSAYCSVAGVDTLISRRDSLVQWGDKINDWTIDEAHHVLKENKWGKAVAMFPNAFGLGVTATPQRADGKGLGSHHDGVFDDMVVGPTSRQLMDMEAITDYDLVVPACDFSIDDSAITGTGDFSPPKMREASKRSHIVGDVVQNYCKWAFGKRAIVFATDVETAGEIAQNFKAFGITAEAVSGNTPATTREEYVRRFRTGQITVLVNVDLFGEGFDVPAVECVILARPTASLAVYLQQCGRALRTMTGKIVGIIIDMVSNYKRHGYPDKDRYWTLDRREKRAPREINPEEIELRPCPKCSRPYERCLPACPKCGHVPEVMPAAGRAGLEQIDGDLILLDRHTLAKLRAEAQLESPAAIKQRVFEQTGSNYAAAGGAFDRQKERLAEQERLSLAIANWAGYQRSLGRSDSESYRRFYLTLGVDVLSAIAAPRADMEKMANTVEGWMK